MCVCESLFMRFLVFVWGQNFWWNVLCTFHLCLYTQAQLSIYMYIIYSWMQIYINLYMHTHTHTHTLHLCALISLGAFLKTRTERRAGGREWTCCSGMSSTHTHVHRNIHRGATGSLEMNTSLKYSVMHNKSAHAIAFSTLVFIQLPSPCWTPC